MDAVKIRIATVKDAKKLLEIYTPYVEKTAISFEYDVPSLEEFTARIKRTLQNTHISWRKRGEKSWDTPIQTLL